MTPLDSIKDVVRSSVKVPESDKHPKKAGGHIGRNVVEITIKMKTIIRKPLMIRLFSVISKSFVGGGLTPLLRSNRYILQPQPTEQPKDK